MFDNVLLDDTKKNVAGIVNNEFLNDFYLAGGTACALHLGHRISYDLDFFSDKKFDTLHLTRKLKNDGDFVIDYSDRDTLTGKFINTNISFIYYKYKMVKEPGTFLGLNIASLEDIGCMKIEAIAARGKKRDFVDLHFILEELQMDLAAFFAFYNNKYAGEKYNEVHILKSFTYFEDADGDPDLNMLKPGKWETIRKFFIKQESILKYAIRRGIDFKSG